MEIVKTNHRGAAAVYSFVGTGLLIAVLFLVLQMTNAQAYQWHFLLTEPNNCGKSICTDHVTIQYKARLLSDMSDPLQPGTYIINILVNGVHGGKLFVTVSNDYSIAAYTTSDDPPPTLIDGSNGTAPVKPFAFSCDGNIYSGTISPITIVGTASIVSPESGNSADSGDGVEYDFVQTPDVVNFGCFNCTDPACSACVATNDTEVITFDLTVPKTCKTPADVPGQATISLDSVHASFGLGVGTNFIGQGLLSINSEGVTTNLARPKGLSAISSGALWETSDANGLRQVLSGDVLADIMTNSLYQYNIRFYRAANAGTLSGGLYSPIGDPFKVVTIQNPDTSTRSNRLWITIAEGNVTNQYQYLYSSNSTVYSNYWELSYPSNLRKETLLTTWDTNWTTKITLRQTYTPGTPDVLVYQEKNKYINYGFGEVLVEQVLGTNGVNLTNTWTYYTNSAQTGSYGYLEQKTEWNGYWEQYQYDSVGRETNRIIAYQNAPAGSAAASCRAISTIYTNTTPQLTKIECILGQEIGRTYTAYYSASNAVKTVRCQTAGASFTDSDNLVSIFSRDSICQPTNSIAVDGTRTFYSYVTNADKSATTTMSTGQGNGGGTAIAEGTKTITVVGGSGQMISNIVFNITGSADGAVLQQDYYSYTSDDYAYRSPTISHLDGTTTIDRTGCCGMPLFGNTVDRDGTTNYFVYDALQRTASSTLNNVTTTNIYDGYGAIVAVERIGTNGTAITNQIAVYDLAERLAAETNALGSPTTYSNTINSDGELVKTTTYADGGTKIETYYLDGTLQSVTGTAVFPVRYTNGVTSDGGVQRAYRAEIKLDSSGADSAECTTNFADMVGRLYKTSYAGASGSPAITSYFNNAGQLTKQVDPDGVTTLYQYNGKGEREYTAVDMNGNGTIDFAGTDRITRTVADVVSDNGTNVRRTRQFVWATNSSGVSNLVSTIETSVDGLKTWNTVWNGGAAVTSSNLTIYDASNGYRIVTNAAPDGSYSVTINQFGRMVSVTSRDAFNNQLSATTYGYDIFGRQNTVTDARDGTATTFYDNADQTIGLVTPVPGTGQSAEATTNYLDSMGRILATTLPDNTSVTNIYSPNGLLHLTYGSRTYPVGYSYDAQGRIKTMTNWSSFASGGARVTTWSYDVYRGWLTNKTYDGGAAGPRYAYTAGGRLQTRVWARGITTTYGYDSAGGLASVSYSDATASVTNGFDRQGRKIAVTNGPTVCLVAYNDVGEVLGETYSGGPLNGLTVTNFYDSLLRRTTNGLWNGSGWLARTYYAYDAASRLGVVSDGTNSAGYSYVANSPLVSQILSTNSGTLRMTTTKSYDNLNRLTSIQSSTGGSTVAAFSYGNNLANQRTSMTNADSSYWVYQYDNLGQVTSGKKYWSDGIPVAGQQFEYNFDDIGNRTSTKAGGDENGLNLQLAHYTNNTLNQITGRDVPGYVNVMGEATNGAMVYVNDQIAYRRTNYFRKELTVDNSAGAVWLGVTNIAVLPNGSSSDILGTNTGNVFLPKTAELFAYDADGNLTNDGRWAYSWDAENRLTNMTSQISAPTASKFKLDFLYDYRGRRLQKIVYTNSGSSYVAESTNKFAYDGWCLTAELAPNNSPIRSYMWGIDCSGTMQGAGGVGGLLKISYYGSAMTNCFVAEDGCGNVNALVNGLDGGVMARYEYASFGELLRATGPMAKLNPFRFSTKYQDEESGLSCYGYRYYDAIEGRWLNRDPLGEFGGLNVYTFVANAPIVTVDPFGLFDDILGQQTIQQQLKLTGTGQITRGIKVGTFRYPRSGECGCWERNLYADFTPTYTEPYTHYVTMTAYIREIRPAPEWDLLYLLGLVEEPEAAAVSVQKILAEAGMHWVAEQSLDISGGKYLYNLSIRRQELNVIDLKDFSVSWLMSSIYKKNGESWKISNANCKPSQQLLDISALTGGLRPVFPDLTQKQYQVMTSVVDIMLGEHIIEL